VVAGCGKGGQLLAAGRGSRARAVTKLALEQTRGSSGAKRE